MEIILLIFGAGLLSEMMFGSSEDDDDLATSRVQQLNKQHDAERRMIHAAGLNREERQAAEELLKQRYLQRLEMLLDNVGDAEPFRSSDGCGGQWR